MRKRETTIEYKRQMRNQAVKNRKQAVAIARSEGRKAGGGKKARERRLADKEIMT
jgi:hypothetical protein